MKKSILYAGSIAFVLVNQTATAQPNSHQEIRPLGSVSHSPSPYHSPLYLGVRAGLSNFAGACSGNDTDCNNNQAGYGLYGGYQFNDWLAIEAGLTDYGKAKAKYSDSDVSFESKGAELTAKLSLPISHDWTAYSRLGGAYQHLDKIGSGAGYHIKQTDNELKALAALGVDYQLSTHWSVRGEYQYIAGAGNSDMHHADINFASVGVTYHFGHSSAPAVAKKAPAKKVVAEPVKKIVKPVAKPKPVAVKAKPAPKMVTKHVSLKSDAMFKTGSYRLKDTKGLDEMSASLKKYKKGTIHITGYTDSTGSAKYNLWLSKRRAQSVANHLIYKGVDPSRIKVSGKGEADPIATNMNRAGRSRNRRVVINLETNATQAQK